MSALSSPPTRGSSGPRGAAARGRSVPVVYAAVTAVLLLAVVGLALSSPPPRTPPLAAVAPQVEDQVEAERVEQSSRFGQGAGGEGDCAPGDEGCAAAGAALEEGSRTQPAPEEVSAPGQFRPCVVGPGGPRQTEDPQSPPCKADIFKGDNGGATWPGVTATEIRIAAPRMRSDDPQVQEEALAAFVEHFNRHYELYGRRLAIVPFDKPGGFDGSDPASHRAFAQEVADADVFATLGYLNFGVYQEELAEHGVVSIVGSGPGLLQAAELRALHPFAWSVFPTHEDGLDATGELICESLAGRPARHGGPEVRDSTRHFGLVQEVPGPSGSFPADVLVSRLRACGADFGVYDFRHGQTDPEVLHRRMREDGVTTVVCVCQQLRSRDYLEVADALGWEPEWLLPGISDSQLHLRVTMAGTGQPRGQMAHVFGLLSSPRRPEQDVQRGRSRYDEQFWFHAAREIDPAFQPTMPASSPYYGYYAELLILASGIQWAGSELTPETFGAALTSLRYPNPAVGALPWWQPSVGFGPDDHSFNSDFALAWWDSPSDAGWESRTDSGRLCYVGGGARVRAGQVPSGADDLFFDPEAGCR